MIDQLRDAGLLSVVRDDHGLIGYHYAGALYEVFEQLDRTLVQLCTEDLPTVAHSCSILMNRSVLDRIGFFDKLPSIPFEAVPHGSGSSGPERFLAPSVCYSTFAHLEDVEQQWDLRSFTVRGRCHRHEPTDPGATRPGSFDMREFVQIGEQDKVVRRCEQLFQRAVALLCALGEDVSVALASDVFYGERSRATRKIQRMLGVKREVLLPWQGKPLAVGSRNLHRELFTTAFGIGPQQPAATMHSTCVAFGLDRLVLALLSTTPGHDPELLGIRLERAFAEVSPAVRA